MLARPVQSGGRVVQEQSEVECLRSENQRLRWALAQAGLDADMATAERADTDARQGADLAISRAETSVARGEARRARSDAAKAERRYGEEVEATASALATSQALVVALRTKDRRQAALIELGDRLRDLRERAAIARAGSEIIGRAVDASRAAYGTLNAVAETMVIEADWCAPGVGSITGLRRFRDYGSFIENLKRGDMVVVDDVATDPLTRENLRAFEAIGMGSLINVPLIEGGRTIGTAIVQHTAPHAWTVDDLAFVTAGADRIRAAMARGEAEARQAMLNGEIAHRLKNTLAIVQAITAQTLRRAPSVAEARKVLLDRLIALGKAHDALMMGRTDATTVGAVVATALTMHGGLGERIATRGTEVEVEVGPSAALSFALMLHELATNAAKYGALSTSAGRVDLTWTVEPAAEGDIFAMAWTERGGPSVTAPTKRGFGSQLIERGFGSSATVSMAFDSAGVVATLRVQLAGLQSGMAPR